MNTMLDARTVAVVKPYTKETRQGINGTFEVEEVLFRIAVDRNYKTTHTENGKTVTDRPTDFWLAKATGPVANVFNDHCTATKENGKLVSRRLLLEGSFETYRKDRVFEKTYQVDLSAYGIQGLVPIAIKDTLPDTQTIFVVSNLKFLDSNPTRQQAAATAGGIAGVAGVAGAPVPAQAAAPVAQNAAPAPQAPAQQAAAAPAQPVQAQAAQASATTQAAPAQTTAASVNPIDGAMNAPTLDPNFAVEGETAPF